MRCLLSQVTWAAWGGPVHADPGFPPGCQGAYAAIANSVKPKAGDRGRWLPYTTGRGGGLYTTHNAQREMNECLPIAYRAHTELTGGRLAWFAGSDPVPAP